MKHSHASETLLLMVTLLLSGSRSEAQTEAALLPSRWVPATLFPHGALLAVVSGDPSQPGQTTAELALPDGYRVPRHHNPMPVRLEVRENMLLVAIGERFDPKKPDTLRLGDTIVIPAGVPHSWVARGRTVVALTFEGPYTITYVNAHEAPRGRSFPFQY